MEALAARMAESIVAPGTAPVASAVGAVFAFALLALFAGASLHLSRVDLRCRRIPNATVALLALGAAVQMALCALPGGAIASPLPALPAPVGRLASAAAVLALGLAFELAWRAAHGGAHGMGMGDIKLAAAYALWVGGLIAIALACACVAAGLVNAVRHRAAFAFGPYIAAGSGACLLVLLLC